MIKLKMLFKKEKHVVICIHGFGRRKSLEFDNLMLWSKKDNINFVTFDLFDASNPDDSSWMKWVDTADKYIKHYIDNDYRVDVIGYSMGGVIASYLSSKHKINRLVLLAPAFNYFHIENITNIILKSSKKILTSSSDNSGSKLPASFYESFSSLVKNLKYSINSVNIPTLIIHGDEDEVIPLRSSLYAIDKIPHDNKRLIILNKGHHRLIQDKNVNNEVYQLIKLFLNKDILPDEPVEYSNMDFNLIVDSYIKPDDN